jgi:hypothetical protein
MICHEFVFQPLALLKLDYSKCCVQACAAQSIGTCNGLKGN